MLVEVVELLLLFHPSCFITQWCLSVIALVPSHLGQRLGGWVYCYGQGWAEPSQTCILPTLSIVKKTVKFSNSEIGSRQSNLSFTQSLSHVTTVSYSDWLPTSVSVVGLMSARFVLLLNIIFPRESESAVIANMEWPVNHHLLLLCWF